ncbi:hypothetical protein HHK36_016851 [Tetracentron sinense]|uniref:Uncharacterized protein n=1 Tax=Tetracentron sinense TaxID=13715 RepID=A0A834Z088_TETSI|nr:hypothetical protein HHK36_016851 [Tetracentron sinense]
MAILYAVVARGTVVLSEFSAVSGNSGAVARRILEKLPSEADSRLCLSQDRYIFHILRSDGLSFLCMANDTFGRRIPFSYLEDVHMRFMKNYGRVAHSAPAYAMNDEFSRVLHQQMEFFSSNPSADTLNRIRTIMVDNIEKILERGDRIELLVDKTATMQDGAFHFKKQSRRLRRALWMKNAKLFFFSGHVSVKDLDQWLNMACQNEEHAFSIIFLDRKSRTCLNAVGLVDMLDSSLAIPYNCCLLWRHHSSVVPVLIHSFLSNKVLLSSAINCYPDDVCLYTLERRLQLSRGSDLQGVFRHLYKCEGSGSNLVDLLCAEALKFFVQVL